MNEQVNVRMPGRLLSAAERYAEKHGFGTIQELIKETVREKIFGEVTLTQEELKLVKSLVEVSEKKKLYGSEEELFARLAEKK